MGARRLIALGSAVGAALLVSAVGGAQRPGYSPQPLFGTPGKAAYCEVEPSGYELLSPLLFCWTPNDGWGVSINWQGRRAYTHYFNRPPTFAEDPGDLRGYAPRAPQLRFGQTWTYNCPNPNTTIGCRSFGSGRLVFRCVSRRTGLTCTNARGHGWWIGRYHGYRLF